MFQGWRLKLREAEQAFGQGCLDEASRLLSRDDLLQYLPGKRLAQKVAKRLAERARQRVAQGNCSAGWRDLQTAQGLVGESDQLLAARQELLELVLAEAERLLDAGDTVRAVSRLESLERRQITCDGMQTLKETARRLESARHLAQRGKFAEAEAQLNSAAVLRPELEIIERHRQVWRESREASRPLTEQLHEAMAGDRWSEALSLADELLALAPQNRLAREARKRAWAEVGTKLSDSRPLVETQACTPSRAARGHQLAGATMCCSTDGPGGGATCGPRFLLWVDAVGGFLVCLGDEVTLGQAVPGNHIDVPILADLSRQHARVCRRGEGYVIEPLREVRVNGSLIEDKAMLSDGDEIELGEGVLLRFRQPHALSASARLDFDSRHRTQPAADSVLLMAESCVLGPKWQNHVVCREWSNDIVLYRQDDQLFCRAMDSIEVDGELSDGRGQITLNSRVSGDDFAMCLEEI